jgi:hypothetical protein
MRLEFPPLKRLVLLLFVVVPIVAWFAVKPIRVVLPHTQGIYCVNELVCVEDPEAAESAMALYDEAFDFVSNTVAALESKPRLIFCSTDACADKFGLEARAALTVGKFGTVIGPRAWNAHLVRHEMIHYVQCEQLGVLKVVRLPSWFVEGMAYSMSGDPRDPLPHPFEAYRSDFDSWFESIDVDLFWHEADRL